MHDVIGRLSNQYEQNDRAQFLVMPALDENDESNFDYKYGVGFTTEFYREQRDIMDDASWRALYMNEPIEREGQLYNPNDLRRFEIYIPEPRNTFVVKANDVTKRVLMGVTYPYADCRW